MVARSSSGLCVLSCEEEEVWRRLGIGRPVCTVRNPFPAGDHTEILGRRGLHDPVRLLHVGRLVKEKGILDCLGAVSLLLRTRRVHLDVIGSGPASEEAVALSRVLRLNDAVRFHGHVPHRELHEIYAQSDILLAPTRWREGFPTVLLEAMSAGVVPVVSPVAGVPDQLENGVNALFVPAESPEAVAEAVESLVAQPSLYDSIRRANVRKIEEYRPDVVARQYSKLLHSVMSHGRE